MNETLAIYNKKQNYQELKEKLIIESNVKATFKSSMQNGEPNLDIYQLEYDGKILVKQSRFRIRRTIMSAACIIVALLVFSIGLGRDRKSRADNDPFSLLNVK